MAEWLLPGVVARATARGVRIYTAASVDALHRQRALLACDGDVDACAGGRPQKIPRPSGSAPRVHPPAHTQPPHRGG